MKKMQNASKVNGGGSWPLPPDGQPQITTQSETRTHAISATSDTVLGVLTGIASYLVICYAITNYALYYIIPHTIRAQWNFLTGALLALLVVLIVWLGVRLFYRQLANSFIMGAAIPAIAILCLVWVIW
jgi:hypothetical protein